MFDDIQKAAIGLKQKEIARIAAEKREFKTIEPLFVAQDPDALVPTRLTFWANCATWTAREAALLVTGYDPKNYRMYGGQEIGAGLDGGMVVGSSYFDKMREVESAWQREEGAPDKATIAKWFVWFDKRGIDTGWIDSLRVVLEAMPAPAQEVTPVSTHQEAIQASAQGAADENKNNGQTERWNESALKELVVFKNSHTVAETAKQFGISESRVYELARKYKEKHSKPTANNPFGI